MFKFGANKPTNQHTNKQTDRAKQGKTICPQYRLGDIKRTPGESSKERRLCSLQRIWRAIMLLSVPSKIRFILKRLKDAVEERIQSE
ncbi:hypothetical protein DPMN_124960 [Dreissena polymorpha]|uniref:Uncharacterized protein n=1 Tax=Dreissena polymorpha TaxID=45954 RepID=A0A9D4JT20_DREPO|nr:hypothetical protein DPMN_124960 [Dreissena polymorpha]